MKGFSDPQDPGPPNLPPISTTHKTQAKFASALDFLEQVKLKFADDPDVYTHFLNIMKDFRNSMIDTPGVIGRVVSLFRGHEDLIVGFNTFLPPEIRTGKEEEATLNGFAQVKIKTGDIDNTPRMASGVFPPSPSHAKSELDQAKNYVKKVKDRFNNEPHIYKSFLEILHNYHREQQPIAEVQLRVAKLFKHHKDLLEQFADFLPGESQQPSPTLDREPENQEVIPEEPKTRRAQPRRKTRGSKKASTPPITTNSTGVSSASSSPQLIPSLNNSPPQIHSDSLSDKSPSLTVVSYDDVEKFARIKIFLGNEKWIEFIKCLDLFNQTIITKYEVLFLTKTLLDQNTELWSWLKEFVGMDNEEFSEDDDLAVGELDLTDCERNGASYRRLPKSFKFKPNSGRKKLCEEVLNDIWISRPTGEEGATFKSSSKNEYEELLFKCEDDRFEWDLITERNASTIKALLVIQRKIKDLPRAEQNCFKLKPEDLSALHISSIKQVYGTKGTEIVKALMEFPASVLPIALARLKQKNIEWNIARQQWIQRWRRVYQDNYYKSLDHEGGNFKYEQKKKLLPQSLLDESRKKYSSRKMNSNVRIVQPEEDFTVYIDDSIYQDLRMLTKKIAEKSLNPVEFDKFDKTWTLLLDTFLGRHIPLNVASKEDEIKCKPITPQYHENNTISDEHVFYGDSPIFVFFRYIQTLSSRLSQAKHFSKNPYIPVKYTPPTHSPKEIKVVTTTPEASQERYQHFIDNLSKLIQNQLDQSIFEDDCRETFGVAAYALYTIDNVMLSLGSHMISLLNDELSIKLVDIYLYESKRNKSSKVEHLYYTNLLASLNSRKKRFRFLFNHKTKLLTVSQLDPEWRPSGSVMVKKTIITDSSDSQISAQSGQHGPGYAEDYYDSEFTTPTVSENGVHPEWQRYFYFLVEGTATSPVGKVFLKRNLRRLTKELGNFVTENTLSINQLMCCIDTQTLKPHYIENTEDLFWRKRTACKKIKREVTEDENAKKQ